ncbi:MAG: hypothetical protein ABSC37_06835 [Xanthobacteraceae bacterium]
MRGIGNSLLGTASVIVLLSGTLMLVPNEASAQFNIEGLIGGAMGHGFYGGSRHRATRHGRVHESSKRAREREDAKDEDSSDHDAKADSKPERRQLSAPSKDDSQASAPAATAGKPRPDNAQNDEPSFAPSR